MRQRSGRRGQAMVETALTLLATITILAAIMDFGQVLMFMQFFTERARAGARWAVVNNWNATQVQNYVVYNNAQPESTGGPGLFGLLPSMVSVRRHDMGMANDRIEVTIQNVPLRFYSPFMWGAYTPRPFCAVFPVEALGANE